MWRYTEKELRKREQDFQNRHSEEKKRRIETPNVRGWSGSNAGTSEDVTPASAPPATEPPSGPPAVVQSFGASNSGGRTDGSETSVDPFYAPRLRPFMDTQNTIHPMYRNFSSSIASGSASTAVKHFSIRINSIWDVFTTLTYAEDPTPAAGVADGANETPIMREFWQNIYRYWTVVKTKYKVRFWTNDNTDQELDIWCYHHGQQMPPITTGGSGGNVLVSKYRRTHRHAHYKTLGTYNSSATEKPLYHGREVVFTGEYRPGNFTVVNDVAEDEYKETWHRITEVPSLQEYVTFIIQRSERSSTSTAVSFSYDVELVFYVQWKDLEAKFQYMDPTQDETFNNFLTEF